VTSRNHTGARIAVVIALLAVAGGISAIVALSGSTPRQNPGVVSHGDPITNVRSVLVVNGPSAEVSQPGKPLRTVLKNGKMPSARTMATVLSDENCAPDARGISHCSNRLRMDDGSEVTVTHPHRMSEVPCLSPGERVSVQGV